MKRMIPIAVVVFASGWFTMSCQHWSRDSASTDPSRITSQPRTPAEAQEQAVAEAAKDKIHPLKQFQDVPIRPAKGYGFRMKEGGEVFELDWENPLLVKDVLGTVSLGVRWFDAQLKEVDTVTSPGRYMAVVDGRTGEGMRIRRGLTFYARPEDWRPELRRPPEFEIGYLPGSPIRPQVWAEHEQAIAEEYRKKFLRDLYMTEEGAIWLTALTEMEPQGRPPLETETPMVLHQETHLALKRRLMGIDKSTYPLLRAPEEIAMDPGRVLHEGTLEEGGMREGTPERLRRICQEWAEESDQPQVTVVARHGVVVFHEVFGEWDGVPIELDFHNDVASISKLVSGLMFAQFVEQGLMEIDQPIGEILPDFPTEGEKAITFRHLFTHTTGLSGHYEWGGLQRPYLENIIANGLGYLEPGRTFEYNGMGYDLAGKAMEVVSGKSVVRLFHENFFRLLGVGETPMHDLGFSMEFSAHDLATIGQLIANRGEYNGRRYFSAETFERLKPKPLVDSYPALAGNKEWAGLEWGIGMVWMREPNPEAGQGDVPEGATLLSANTVGHGSASACILRVDLDNDVVVAQVRRTAGDAETYFKYNNLLFKEIDESLID